MSETIDALAERLDRLSRSDPHDADAVFDLVVEVLVLTRHGLADLRREVDALKAKSPTRYRLPCGCTGTIGAGPVATIVCAPHLENPPTIEEWQAGENL